jgi:hypothetical protein
MLKRFELDKVKGAKTPMPQVATSTLILMAKKWIKRYIAP